MVSLVRKIPLAVFLLFGLSLAVHLWGIEFPARVVFDEAHFGLYATKYIAHEYYFDIHPPLGKLILALGAWMGGIQPGFSFEAGTPYGPMHFWILRMIPALFGSLLPVLAYGIMRQMKFSQRAAFMAAFFVLFDNALLLQSRLILMDSMLLFFIFLSLLLFIRLRMQRFPSKHWYVFAFLCGLSIGGAMSVKVIGFGILGLIWLWFLAEYKVFRESTKSLIPRLAFLLVLPVLVWFSLFIVHFALLTKSCEQNCGYVLENDLSGIHPRGSLNEQSFSSFNALKEGNLLTKLAYEYLSMFTNTISQEASHPYKSKWYGWPLLIRPVLYSEAFHNGQVQLLYFVGNPAVWWGSFLGVLLFAYVMAISYFKLRKAIVERKTMENVCLLYIGFGIFWCFFALADRPLFLYHYLAALMFACMISALFLDWLFCHLSRAQQKAAFTAVLLVVIACFLYVAPFTYGFSVDKHELKERTFLFLWK